MACVPHLCNQSGLFGRTRHQAGFLDTVSHRLFHVNMPARPQRSQRDRRMHVVGSTDRNGIDVAAFFQKHAIVLENLCVGKFLERANGVFPVDVAQRDDILLQPAHRPHQAAALATHADSRDVQFFTRSGVPRPAQRAARNDLKAVCRARHRSKEPTPAHSCMNPAFSTNVHCCHCAALTKMPTFPIASTKLPHLRTETIGRCRDSG